MEQLFQLASPAAAIVFTLAGIQRVWFLATAPQQPFAPAQRGCKALPNHHGRVLRRCKQLLRGQNNTESGLEMLRFGFPRVFNSGFQVCKHAVINSLEALTVSPMARVLTAVLGKEEDGLNPSQLIFCWDPREIACQRALEVNVVLRLLWRALLSALAGLLASAIVQNCSQMLQSTPFKWAE